MGQRDHPGRARHVVPTQRRPARERHGSACPGPGGRLMAAVLRAAASRSRLRPTDITTRQHVLAWAAVPSHNSQPANPKGAAMTSLRRDPEERQRASSAARTTARRSALNLARAAGAQVISRPIFPGAHTTTGDVEPLAGLQASRDIELGARHIARGYIRDAREAGHGWQAIGIALDLTPDADRAGQSIAEAGYTYAAGDPDTDTARRYGRSFGWTCRSCDGIISDRGLCNGPVDDEHGPAPGCVRLAAAE